MNVKGDQLIVNAAVRRGIMSKSFCKLFELLRVQQLSIMQQFRGFAFDTVVHWHKSGSMDSECTSHNSIVLAICVPKISKFGEYLTTFRQKQVGSFFVPPCILLYYTTYQILMDFQHSLTDTHRNLPTTHVTCCCTAFWSILVIFWILRSLRCD